MAKFENMAQSSSEEDRKRVDEERTRRIARDQKERETAKKREEVWMLTDVEFVVGHDFIGPFTD